MTLFCFEDGIFKPRRSTAITGMSAFQVELNQSGITLHIKPNAFLDEPLRLLFLTHKESQQILQNTIILGENSSLTLIEEFQSTAQHPYQVNINTCLQIEKNASLSYFKIQNESLQAFHQANLLINQKKSSTLSMVLTDFGSQKAQHKVEVNLSEETAEIAAYAMYFLEGTHQEIHHDMFVNHHASKVKSLMLYKGILNNKSKSFFRGRAYVAEKTKQIVAHQASHHLLLSTQAEANSKPELEIYADDVKCTHGATMGQLDLDALFYLRSRGLEKETAVSMLTRAFAADVLDKITEPSVHQYVERRVCSDVY